MPSEKLCHTKSSSCITATLGSEKVYAEQKHVKGGEATGGRQGGGGGGEDGGSTFIRLLL